MQTRSINELSGRCTDDASVVLLQTALEAEKRRVSEFGECTAAMQTCGIGVLSRGCNVDASAVLLEAAPELEKRSVSESVNRRTY